MELSRKIIILIYGRALSFLISLIIPIALTRLLLKEDYGSYQQLVMIYSIIQAISSNLERAIAPSGLYCPACK